MSNKDQNTQKGNSEKSEKTKLLFQIIIGVLGAITAAFVLLTAYTEYIDQKEEREATEIAVAKLTEIAINESPTYTVTNTSTPTTITETYTPTPTAISTFASTLTNTPTVTPSDVTATIEPISMPFFFDEFNGNEIDKSKWNIIEPGMWLDSGRLNFDIRNKGLSHYAQYIDAIKYYDQIIGTIEFEVTILSASEDAGFEIHTNCGDDPDMVLRITGYKRIDGYYSTPEGLNKELIFGDIDFGIPYKISLVQQDEGIFVLVNNEMIADVYFPCKNMRTIRLEAGASPNNNYVKGYVDYIKVYSLINQNDWLLYEDFKSDSLTPNRWAIDGDVDNKIDQGILHYIGEDADREFSLSLNLKKEYLQEIKCSFPQGISLIAKINEGTENNSFIALHSGWNDKNYGLSQYRFELAGGPEVRVRYDNPNQSGDVGTETGLEYGKYYEIATIWDESENHFYLNGMQIQLYEPIPASEFFGDYIAIRFSHQFDGYLDVELFEVWVKCR